MVKVKNKKGNIGLLLLLIMIIFVLAMTSLIKLERKTMSIKRQNIHNAVVAANLASYYAIERGNKEAVLDIPPETLSDLLIAPDQISYYGTNIKNVVNLLTSEYLMERYRYQCIYIEPSTAYEYFKKYLDKNLGLTQKKEYVFTPTSEKNNKGGILEMKINSFEVYNAIYGSMKNPPISQLLKNEKRVYSGIHLDLTSVVNHDINYRKISGTVNIPIHLDTEISLFRPTIK